MIEQLLQFHATNCIESIYFNIEFEFVSNAVHICDILYGYALYRSWCSFHVIAVVNSWVLVIFIIDQWDFEYIKLLIYRCKLDRIGFRINAKFVRFLQWSFLDVHSKHFFGHYTSFEILSEISVHSELFIVNKEGVVPYYLSVWYANVRNLLIWLKKLCNVDFQRGNNFYVKFYWMIDVNNVAQVRYLFVRSNSRVCLGLQTVQLFLL